MWIALGLSVVVAAYNNIANRWKPFQGAAYVPLNLLLAAAKASAVSTGLGVTRTQLGLTADPRDALLPVAVVVIFAIGMLVLARSRHAHRIADQRVADRRGGSLVSYVLVRIPLGTAVAEEVIFRGALFAAWRAAGLSDGAAALGASIVFGLWHVAPTRIGLRMNDPGASRRKVVNVILGAVLATALAGLALTWLRVTSGSLLGPVLVHAGVNSISALAAAAWRRRDPV